jgi:hypothetical protein
MIQGQLTWRLIWALKDLHLFGPHTTPEKVSIERETFIALQTTDLKSLFADRVYALIKSSIAN